MDTATTVRTLGVCILIISTTTYERRLECKVVDLIDLI